MYNNATQWFRGAPVNSPAPLQPRLRGAMVRPPLKDAPPQTMEVPTFGFGARSMWPLPPVGEAARRDPHIPDPTPGMQRPPLDQRDISPSVANVGGMHAGGGGAMTGQHPYIVYIKRLGNAMTRTLARNY